MRNNKTIIKEINSPSTPDSGARQSKKDDVLDSRRKGRLPKSEATRDAKSDKGEAARRARDKQLGIDRDSVTQENTGCSNV